MYLSSERVERLMSDAQGRTWGVCQMRVKVGDLKQPKGPSADLGVPGLNIGTVLRGPASAVLASGSALAGASGGGA